MFGQRIEKAKRSLDPFKELDDEDSIGIQLELPLRHKIRPRLFVYKLKRLNVRAVSFTRDESRIRIAKGCFKDIGDADIAARDLAVQL